ERQHREVDTGEAHAEEAEEHRKEPRHHAGGGEGEEERHPELLHEDAGRVGADAEVGGVPERDEPGVADEEVEAGGEERPDHDIVGQERVEARAQRGHEERRDHDEQAPGHAREHGYFRGLPRRPQGRMTSTVAMRAKMAKMEKRGKKRMPNDRTWP